MTHRVEQRDLTPDQAAVLGAKLCDAGQLDEAESVFRAILKVEPEHFHATHRLGTTLAKKKSFYEALYRFDRALKINRRSAVVWGNRGMVIHQLGHCGESIHDFERSLAIEPANPIVWANLGNALERTQRYGEALDALDRAINLDPKAATPYYNRGIVYCRTNEHELALDDFETAIAIEPNFPDAHFNLGLTALLLGDYARGFREYEWRWETEDYAAYRDNFPQPKWLGGEVPNTVKNLLVYGDQGLGDSIMFARYIPMMQSAGWHVFLIPHAPLIELFAASFPGCTILRKGEPLPPNCHRLPLPSAPLAFGTRRNTIPKPAKFTGFADRLPALAERINAAGAGPKIGVVWSGNWTHRNDEHRSIALKRFKQLFALVPQAHWFSLQYEVRPVDVPELPPELNRLPLTDWLDTAAAVSALDLVVTVDTSVAHLAGSLGTRTFTLIPQYGVDWRWGLMNDGTPWYPRMRLFRQRERGRWGNVFNRIADAIRGEFSEGFVSGDQRRTASAG